MERCGGQLTRFFSHQVKVVLERCGAVDPERLEDYVATGGYEALAKALTTMAPEDVIAEVVRSGLRGRGGAGYPTGLKWRTVAKATAPRASTSSAMRTRVTRALLWTAACSESCPQQVLEGMAIAGYAVGAKRGYVYVRAEYPLAVKRLSSAIRQAERDGHLGSEIAGTRFDFQVEVRIGAGAFVCGEETALIASIQGGRGTPRPRPPYPAASGLWGCPTLINNVETFANIAAVIMRGGDWLSAIGTERSKGTKVFALTGAVTNTGLIEVPMGLTLRQIVFEIGGGLAEGRRFKAVQTGGPSGGCIPKSLLDMPVDYETLAQAGSIMGSGGMIVMDDRTCMVDVAKFFMDFCREESCGKCLPCRVGHRGDVPAARQDNHGRGHSGPLGPTGKSGDNGKSDQPVRPRPRRSEPSLLHAALFPGRVPGPYRRPRVPGGRVPGRCRASAGAVETELAGSGTMSGGRGQ